MNIRQADHRDSAAISALARSLSEKYVTPGMPESAATAFLGSMMPEGIDNNLRNGYRYHVAVVNGRIVGTIGINGNSHVYHLFVSEEFHRRGIARRLWDVAKNACMAAGNNEGFTVNSSTYAQPVYERLGFVAQSGPQERDGVISIPMKMNLTR